MLWKLYGKGPVRPLWLDASGRPNPDAWDAVAMLGTSAADGLDPADYRSQGLAMQLSLVTQAPLPVDPQRLADVDVGLSLAVLRYFRHLHRGRIDPTDLGVRLDAEPEHHDVVELLRGALETHTVPAAAASLAPRLPQ